MFSRLLPSCLLPRRSIALGRLGLEADGSSGGGGGPRNDDDDSSESRLDLVDGELGHVHREVMAKTGNKYLRLEGASFPDRMFTGTLIVLTMLAILVLFWYQVRTSPHAVLLHDCKSIALHFLRRTSGPASIPRVQRNTTRRSTSSPTTLSPISSRLIREPFEAHIVSDVLWTPSIAKQINTHTML